MRSTTRSLFSAGRPEVVELTRAVRPAAGGPRLTAGYRRERFQDPASRRELAVVSALVPAARLFDVFLALLEPLGEVVDVVLESSHDSQRPGQHQDFRRDEIERPILVSNLFDHEEMLLHDGCTGLAVMSSRLGVEVQFDEHKQLYVYARKTLPFRAILRDYGLQEIAGMRLISDDDHWHATEPRFADEFEQFQHQLGAGAVRSGRRSRRAD